MVKLELTEEQYWVLRDALTMTLETVSDLDDDELDDYGLSGLEDRLRMVNSLQEIADQAEAAYRSRS